MPRQVKVARGTAFMQQSDGPRRHGAQRGRAAGGAPALAWAGARPLAPQLAGLIETARDWLSRQGAIEADQRRLFLWLPACMGLGILLYFGAAQEPDAWAPVAAMLAFAAAAALLARRGGLGFRLALAGAAVFAGFSAGCWRTARVAAPVLERPRMVRVLAVVEAVEARTQGGRLLLRPLEIQGLASDRTPYRVRVTTPNRPAVQAGDVISALARLMPPPEASRPGGYDFAREAWFSRIGAVGSLPGAIELVPEARELGWGLRLAAAIDRARNAVTARIATAIGGAAGGVAASLVTGKRGLIPEAVNDDLRAAGIYHVVSISGLHMVLAAGMVFWAVRAALALAPGLALHWPIKKMAAFSAILAAIAYNGFAGSEIATQRALVMTVVLLGATFADRPAFSMRNLAAAALVVLAMEPESLLGPSFQMSFAAVAALIAMFERPGRAGLEPEGLGLSGLGGASPLPAAAHGPMRRAMLSAGRYVGLAVLTTLVAEAATGPFGLYHFQRFTPFGVVGNALTLPLVSLVVMPAAVIGIVAIPFGWDGPVWQIMGWGVEGMLQISAMVAAWPGSTAAVPAFGAGALACLSAAILAATLCRSALRVVAVPLLAGGALMALAAPRPDLVVTADGRALAVRGPGGDLGVVGRRPSAFTLEQWLRADGDRRAVEDPSLFRASRCDASGCVARLPDGRPVAQVLLPQAFEEDCRRAAVVVTALRAPAFCRPPLLIDARRLAGTGALELAPGSRIDADSAANDGAERSGYGIRAARSAGQDRPWMRRPQEQRGASATGAAGAGVADRPQGPATSRSGAAADSNSPAGRAPPSGRVVPPGSEPAQAEGGQAVSGQPASGGPESGRPASARPESGRPESGTSAARGDPPAPPGAPGASGTHRGAPGDARRGSVERPHALPPAQPSQEAVPDDTADSWDPRP